MKKPFNNRDLKKILNRSENILNLINDSIIQPDKYFEKIKKAIDGCLEEEALEKLKSINIEELNRNKDGIRIKTLKDYGINNFYDLTKYDERTLASINGISADKSRIIYQIVNEIKNDLI